jgi:hypothetical protein
MAAFGFRGKIVPKLFWVYVLSIQIDSELETSFLPIKTSLTLRSSILRLCQYGKKIFYHPYHK